MKQTGQRCAKKQATVNVRCSPGKIKQLVQPGECCAGEAQRRSQRPGAVTHRPAKGYFFSPLMRNPEQPPLQQQELAEST